MVLSRIIRGLCPSELESRMSYRNTITGTLGAAQATVEIATRYNRAAKVGVQLSGTFSATVGFEVTLDGTNWIGIELRKASDMSDTGLADSSTSAGVFGGRSEER